MGDAEAALEGFLDAFEPAIANQAREAIQFFRDRLPQAHQLVYDNYNALAIGFASGEKQSTIAFSVTLYPRWVSLFFTRGSELRDRHSLLVGSGSQIRHIVLKDGRTHEDPAVLGLIDEAIDLLEPPLSNEERGTLLIKSVSAKRRPRRP